MAPLDLSFHICEMGIRMNLLPHRRAVGRTFIPVCWFTQLVCNDDLMCGRHCVSCASTGQSRQELSPWSSQPHWGDLMHVTELERSYYCTHNYHTNNYTLLINYAIVLYK